MIRSLLIWGILLSTCALSSFAQTITLSPYSRYGLGDLYQNTTARNMAMGDLSVATSHFASINRINPASYSDLIYTTLDVSGFFQQSNLETSRGKESQFSASFQNLSFGFPSNKGPVFVMGFAPYTGVGYNVTRLDSIPDGDNTVTYRRSYSGEGGLNEAFLGMGWRMFKSRLRVGANFYYTFGSLQYQSDLTILAGTTGNVSSASYLEEVYLSGPGIQVGLIYTDTLSGKVRNQVKGQKREPVTLLRIGATLDYNIKLSGDRVRLYANAFIPEADTLVNANGERLQIGNVEIPARLGFGFALSRPGSWEISAEATYQDWSKFSSFASSIAAQSSTRFAAGGEWIPNFDGNKYLGRIAYRGGFFYDQGYLVVSDNPVSDYGVSFGLGLPASRKGTSVFNRERIFSQVNLGISVGRRGNLNSQPLQELYIKGRVGVTINERWFRRYKVD